MKLNYKHKKTMLKKVCKLKEDALYPIVVSQVAEHMERNPDPWFMGSIGYDYYFTGCNLAVIKEDKFKWIVNTAGREMNTIEVIPFNVVGRQLDIDSSQTERYELEREKGPVFEVCWSKSENSHTHTTKAIIRIALRRKNDIEIMWTNKGHDNLKRKSIYSEVPFISCCLLPGADGWLICTSDLENVIKLWDCNQDEILFSLRLPKDNENDDCWTCIRFVPNGYLVRLSRTSLNLIKIDGTELVIMRKIDISHWLWDCEKASCLEIRPKERIVSLGTTHKLLIFSLIDKTEEPLDLQHILTFTHNLKQHPTMISMGSDNKQNIQVWISSQLPGDSKVCSLTKTPTKNFVSKFLPLKPYNVQDACQLARIEGKCIYPASVLQRRLQLLQCGLVMIVSSGHYHLLLQNSCGDIFHQRLIQDPTNSNASMIPARFQSWMQQLNSYTNNGHEPIATDFKNLRGFKKILTCSSLQRRIDLRPTNDFFIKRPRWQQSVEQLHRYKDFLAADMLSIWGFRPEVTRRPSTDDTVNVTDRISAWLETATDSTTLLQDSIKFEDYVLDGGNDPVGDLSDVMKKEPVSAATQEETPALDVTVVGITPNVPSEIRKSIVKPARRKYVKGF